MMVSQIKQDLTMPVPFEGRSKVTKASGMTPAPKSVTDPGAPKEPKCPHELIPTSTPPVSSTISYNRVTNTDSSVFKNYSDASPDFGELSDTADSKDETLEDALGEFMFDQKDEFEQESEVADHLETVAQSSLPWRRQTSLPPVPSSVTSSLPDDENPLMSEVPSWANNLAYSHLTESGSPYTSPQATIVIRPPEISHRPLFDLFPTTTLQHSSDAISSIPPPWAFKGHVTDRQEDEPIPSQVLAGGDSGDKASCLLISGHDRAPPSYHSCLQASFCGVDTSLRRHSDVGSPIHFQCIQKPDALSVADLECNLIGIEEDYFQGMADRVSRWLADTGPASENINDHDTDHLRSLERQNILDSLNSKQALEETDDGTDADVESDDDEPVHCHF